MSSSQSYLIIGAGVFGVSTALHLIQKYPRAQVTILDRDAYDAETRVAASWDWNKVIRADYDDLVYCRLGLEAQDIFESDPLFQPYFHKTGIYWMCRSDYAQDVVNNYSKLGRKADLKAVPVSEARKLYNGIFQDSDYSDVKEVLVNKTSGWVAAGDCLRAVTKRAIELGVKYKVGEVQTLTFDSNGRCTGAKTTAGEHVTATQVVLSTGAYTSKLLEHSAAASGNTNLRAESRIVAGGITTGMVKLDDELYKRYAKMPVGVQGYTNETGPFIGSLPPTPDRELKWWGQKIFRNTQQVLPGRFISAPPVAHEYGQWDASKKLKEDIDHASYVFYGKDGANWKKEKLRICWDAFTASGDFIISPHAGAPGLFVATCGNFHGWKFFPVIGKYVVEMLEGRMEEELVQKWAWDRVQPDPGAFADYPRWELKNLADPRREAKL